MLPTEPRLLPMLFGGDLVCALLAGRKTVTRRPIAGEGRPSKVHPGPCVCADIPAMDTPCPGCRYRFPRPPCFPGDTLYVRETFHTYCKHERQPDESYQPTMYAVFRAEMNPVEASKFLWKPSIHMPKSIARIFLRVTSVRIERVQDIDQDKAVAEGMADRDTFAGAWSGIYDPLGLGWDDNPWVYVIEFERTTNPGVSA